MGCNCEIYIIFYNITHNLIFTDKVSGVSVLTPDQKSSAMSADLENPLGNPVFSVVGNSRYSRSVTGISTSK